MNLGILSCVVLHHNVSLLYSLVHVSTEILGCLSLQKSLCLQAELHNLKIFFVCIVHC